MQTSDTAGRSGACCHGSPEVAGSIRCCHFSDLCHVSVFDRHIPLTSVCRRAKCGHFDRSCTNPHPFLLRHPHTQPLPPPSPLVKALEAELKTVICRAVNHSWTRSPSMTSVPQGDSYNKTVYHTLCPAELSRIFRHRLLIMAASVVQFHPFYTPS